MRKTKMDNFVTLAKKQKNPIALAVSSALIAVDGSLVVWAKLLRDALKGALGFEHGVKSVTCSVKVTDPDGNVLMARGQTQAKGSALPTDDAELRTIEDEALLQACEAHLRECEMGHYP